MEYHLKGIIKTNKEDNYGLGVFEYTRNDFSHVVLDDKKQYSYIIRNNDNWIINKNDHLDFDPSQSIILFRVRKSFEDENKYEIIKPVYDNLTPSKDNIKYLINLAWYVVKSEVKFSNDCILNEISNDNEDYILNENDIIKLIGNMYKIIKININKKQDNQDNKSLNEQIYNISNINKKARAIFNINISINNDKYSKDSNDENKENKKCDCKSDKSTEDNPLIKLCACKNFFIHYNCLKKMLKEGLIIKNDNPKVKTYICQNFYCNNCKTPYPLRFKNEGNKVYYLIDLEFPNSNYIILESLNYREKDKLIKRVYVVELKERITIGKANDNDIIIDENISRHHAVLKYNQEKGNIILENLSEKYGTLVLIKGNIEMKEKNIHFQVGKSLITLSLIKKEKKENIQQ